MTRGDGKSVGGTFSEERRGLRDLLHEGQLVANQARGVAQQASGAADQARRVADHGLRHVQHVSTVLADFEPDAQFNVAPDQQIEAPLAAYEHRAMGHQRSVPGRELLLLAAIVRLERRVSQRVDELVNACRRSGATWADIAAALGTSRQAAHERFGPRSARRPGRTA